MRVHESRIEKNWKKKESLVIIIFFVLHKIENTEYPFFLSLSYSLL
jgi:hypothetical protein